KVLEANGICEHSLRKIVACSCPRIFSVRSLSSNPPNQTSDSPGNRATKSALSNSTLTPGKQSLSIFGQVSWTTEALTCESRNRKTACLDPGAAIARKAKACRNPKVL